MPSLRDRIRGLLAKKKKTDSPQPTTPSKPGQVPAGQTQSEQAPLQESTSQQPVVPPAPVHENTQQQPIGEERATAAVTPATSSGMLKVLLQNQTNSSNVYAYISKSSMISCFRARITNFPQAGSAIDHNGALFLLQSDAKTAYYPASPSANGSALAQNVSIPLGAPGNTVTATIPRLAGGRIWMSIDAPLVFKVNPGPGLVEPSVFNQSDPNINTNFGFAEFTFNSSQVFANISYVDFVGAPISLTLTDTSGASQHVSGLPANGLDTICNGLKAQTAKDNQHWSSLIVTNNGKNLRALSPNSGILLNPTWFQTYWTDYVNQVYSAYSSKPLAVDTQAGYGNVNGQTNGTNALNFGAGGNFAKPSAKDIFSCSTGPFATGSNAETNVIIPRLAAAFNRSTLLLPNGNNNPNGVSSNQYYSTTPTNVSLLQLLLLLGLCSSLANASHSIMRVSCTLLI
nr:glucan endo-1,3-beta-glucosidase [Quercus suber]